MSKVQATYSRIRGGTVPMLDIKERAVIEKIVAKDGLKLAFLVWLAVRIIMSVWGALVASQTPRATYDAVHKIYPWLALPNGDLSGYMLGIWNAWDTPHYVTIASQGYGVNPDYLTAFFPGFPIMTKIAGTLLFGNYLLGALIVANICCIIYLWYLYRLVEADYGEAVARRAVILGAIFPTSFYLFLGYTEAPLLAFTLAALYYARQQKWWLAGLLAGCAALTKQPGVFLVFPLVYMYLRQFFTDHSISRKSFIKLLKKPRWAWLLLIPAAALSYYAYRYFFLQANITSANDLGADEIVTLVGVPFVDALRMMRPENPLLLANMMDTGFAVLMIGGVAGAILKIRSVTYSLYAVLIAAISLAITQSAGVSPFRPEEDMPRRLLIIFPIFIYMALVTQNKRVFQYVTVVSFVLFLALSGLFLNWFFVS